MTFRPTRAAVAPLAALAVLLSAACATLRRQAFSPPIVTVTDARLAGVGFDGGRIDVRLSLYNPNGYRLDATSVEYRVLVDTMQIATGTLEQHLTLQKRETAEVRIPVSFGLREVAAAWNQLAARGSLPFQLVGAIRVATPFGGVTRPFDQRGTFDGLNISLLPPRR